MQAQGDRNIDAVIASHIELVRSADEWEAEIEELAAKGSHSDKIEGIEALEKVAGVWSRAVAILAPHSDDAIYAAEKPDVAASLLAMRDYFARMHAIAVDGAQLLEEHL